MSRVSAVIVCMNKPEVLYPCLDSMRERNSCAPDIWVVAYMFSKANLAGLKARYPDIHIAESNETRGFAENNNLALRQIDSEFVFVVNDDTLQDMPVLDKLLDDMDRLPAKVAAISPKLIYPDGRLQYCGRDPWTACQWLGSLAHLRQEGIASEKSIKQGLFRSFTLSGAAFLARTSAFREAGWFDERYFFTPEDVALGQRFNEMGYEVWADADAVITHIANASAGALEAAIKPARILGALHFFAKGSRIRKCLLACCVWTIQAARSLKYLITGCHSARDRVYKAAARNSMKAVFSGMSPKEAFLFFRDGEPETPAKHILHVGEYYKSGKAGGIVSVLRCYAASFKPFRFVPSSRGKSLISKLFYDFGGLIRMLFMLPGTKVVHIHTAGRKAFLKHRHYLNLAKLFGKKAVLHMHAGEFHIFYSEESSQAQKKKILRTLNKADVILVLSESWKQWYRNAGVTTRIEILNNTVERPAAKPHKTGMPLNLLYLGDIREAKGVFELVRAVALLPQDIRSGISLSLAGKGKDDVLSSLIASLGLQDCVHFEGFVSGEQKQALLAAADVIVLPSHNEGLPVSLLEGMSYGCAVLATPVGGIPEIAGSDNGILVQAGDIRGIADAIASLAGQDISPMKRASLKRIEAFYPERVIPRLEDIYNSLIISKFAEH